MQRIIHLQVIANNVFDAFNGASKVNKSHITVVNTVARIVFLKEHAEMD